jgi:hypothetical protein
MLENILNTCSFVYIRKDFGSNFLLVFLVFFGLFTPFIIIIISYIGVYFSLKQNQIFRLNFSSDINSFNGSYSEKKIKSFIFNHQSNIIEHLNKIQLDILNNIVAKRGSFYDIILFNQALQGLRYGKRRNAIKINECFFKDKKNNFFFNREVKVAKSILAKLILFCLNYIPYCIIIIIAHQKEEHLHSPYTIALPILLAKSSTILNPLIFIIGYKEFRLYFIRKINLR